jgi:uncharacterized membrane protein
MTARMHESPGVRDAIAQRVRQREVDRQLLWSRVARAMRAPLDALRRGPGIPRLLPEYLKVLAGSIIGFWLLGWLLSLVHVSPVWTCVMFGALYSGQTTWYGHRLAVDPTFRIPRCGCAGASHDRAETVLASSSSRLAGIPTAAWSFAFYVAFAAATLAGLHRAAMIAALAAVVASAAFAFVMVARVRALCAACVNIAALNVLLLAHTLR